jgi:hypothetical protein
VEVVEVTEEMEVGVDNEAVMGHVKSKTVLLNANARRDQNCPVWKSGVRFIWFRK